jgi:hypothetical protein
LCLLAVLLHAGMMRVVDHRDQDQVLGSKEASALLGMNICSV